MGIITKTPKTPKTLITKTPKTPKILASSVSKTPKILTASVSDMSDLRLRPVLFGGETTRECNIRLVRPHANAIFVVPTINSLVQLSECSLVRPHANAIFA